MSICRTIKANGERDNESFPLWQQIAVIVFSLISMTICTHSAYVTHCLMHEDNPSKCMNTLLVVIISLLWCAFFIFIHRIRQQDRTRFQKWEDIKTVLVTTWCVAGVFSVMYVAICQSSEYSIYKVNNVLYERYTSTFNRYVADWADETRKDSDYTTIMQDDGWIGVDLHDNQKEYIHIAIKTPNGSTYILPSINTTTQRVPATIKKLSEEFNTQDYVNVWDAFHNKARHYPKAHKDIPNKDIILEDAEYIKYKLTELTTDLQDAEGTCGD